MSTNVIAAFMISGKRVELKSGVLYSFIEPRMEFYKDSDGLINSKCGCQWTIADFAAEVNDFGKFPTQIEE
jgi:hypothetical protein